jgi:hypothetical protein
VKEKAGEKAEEKKVKKRKKVKMKSEKMRLGEKTGKQGGGKTQLHSRGSLSSSAGRARRKAFVQRSLPTCSGGLE